MLNKIILMGRLCADPDFKQTQSGVCVCRFRIAVDRRYSSADGGKQTDFISIVCWRKTAEFVNRYFHKGSMAIVEGSLQNADYTDNNGTKHYAMEVNADNVQFGESRAANQNSNAYATPGTPQAANNYDVTAEIGDLSDFEEVLTDGNVPF